MENPSTFLSDDKVKRVVHAAAEEIRSFLSFLNQPQKGSSYRSLTNRAKLLRGLTAEMRQTARLFAQKPERFSDAAMVRMGQGLRKAVKNFVRMEIRRAPGIAGAAQVVSKGIEGDFREVALKNFRRRKGFKASEMTIKFAGRSSIEFNVGGVNKGLPFRYLSHRLDHVLKQMIYSGGALIDSRISRTIIAADGDSTMFGGPTLTKIPTLAESPTREALNEYLAMGGVFLLISGNNLERTQMRLRGGIKKPFRHRVILVGNGGSSMAVYGKDGQLREIEDYRLHALKYKGSAARKLDVIYIGNDGHPHGNDMAGFKEVGYGRSFLVEEEGALIVAPLRKHFIPGNEKAAGKLLRAVNRMLNAKTEAPYFTPASLAQIIKDVRS